MEPPTKNLGCSLAERPIKSEIVQRLDKARKMRDEKKKEKRGIQAKDGEGEANY